MDEIDAFNKAHVNPYCEATDGHFLLHAQVGSTSDMGISPGTRIPIGEEPGGAYRSSASLREVSQILPVRDRRYFSYRYDGA